MSKQEFDFLKKKYLFKNKNPARADKNPVSFDI